MQTELQHLPTRIAAACVTFAPVLVALGILASSSEVSPLEFAGADPLVRLLGYPAATIATVLAGMLVCAYWIRWHSPSRPHLRSAAIWGGLGAAIASSILLLIYSLQGPVIPAFIPPEESAQAGTVLGLTAGIMEEIVFRLVALPALLVLLPGRLSPIRKALLASFLVGLLFAGSHELVGDPFQLQYFVTRTLIPGALMSLAFLKIHPAAILYGHSAAHIVIPLLFVSSTG